MYPFLSRGRYGQIKSIQSVLLQYFKPEVVSVRKEIHLDFFFLSRYVRVKGKLALILHPLRFKIHADQKSGGGNIWRQGGGKRSLVSYNGRFAT